MIRLPKYRPALFLAVVFAALFMAGPAFAATYYVPDDFGTIQAALDDVSVVGGDYIIVRDGTYLGAGNKNLDFGGKAITLRSENGAASTIIDCEGDGRGFYFHSGETSTSVVDGFTIINGSAPSSGGGGIYCFAGSSPTITNCIITNNTAILGGGIYCHSNSSPIISNCDISGNTAGYGGGINCTSDSSPTITNCTLTGNSATNYGGAIRCAYDSNAVISGCTISGNNADVQGGGIHTYSYSAPTVTNCEITGNTSGDSGGGFYCDYYSSPSIVHCTVTGNTAANSGGGIYSFQSSSPIVTNSIFWSNSASAGNEIAVGTTAYPASLTVSYSDVEGGSAAASVESGCTLTWGAGNIDANPLFVGGGDYHLINVSPCIDVATDAGVAVDKDGDARPQDAGPEMGSDEFSGLCSYSILPTSDSFAVGGGTGSTDVTAPIECGWLAVSNDAWITIISGSSGNGNGVVGYAVAPNPDSSPRIGTVTIGTETLTIDQPGAPCVYSITPTSATPDSSGGEDSTIVTSPGGCAWTAVSNDAWITIISGSSGSGNGVVGYAVAANPDSSPRTGTVTIGTETLTIDQAAAPCTQSILPAGATPDFNGGDNSTVVTSPSGCAWTAVSNDGWITITSGSSGSGNGVVGYAVAANPDSSPRTGTVTIGTETLTIDQEGAPCTYSVIPTGDSFDSSGGTGSLSVTSGDGCAWTAISNAPWITITAGSSGSGIGTVDYTVSANPGLDLRAGSITVETETYVINQAGIVPYYVPDDYPTIQAALVDVPAGSIVIVRDGVYTGPDNTDLEFGGKSLMLVSENGPTNCIIDGENTRGGFVFWAGETSGAIVDGFTIRNGNAGSGGGIYISGASPTITNCIIRDCTSSGSGGGIASVTGGSPTITNCTIANNSATTNGGGIYIDADSSPYISSCIIIGNLAPTSSGGGLHIDGDSAAVIVNCTFSGNVAGWGGGIGLRDYSGTIINCISWDNSANDGGDEIYLNNSDLTITHCDVDGGQGSVDVGESSVLNWGAGNIDADPLFVSPGYRDGGPWVDGDYHLTTDSPCIDAGTDAGVYEDIDGDIRPGGAGFDIGADEYYDAPGIGLYPEDSLSNSCLQGENALPQEIEVWNSLGGQLVYSITDDADWLWCSPDSGTSTGETDSITVYYNTAFLDSGAYSATITISDPNASNSPVSLDVVLVVGQPTLTQISCIYPPEGASVFNTPSFTWETDVNINNMYAVDLFLSPAGPFYSTWENAHIPIAVERWDMPASMWNRIPHGSTVYWRVRGADLSLSPPTVVISDEVWWFYKY